MRIYFKSLTRPKRLALRLKILIPALSLMQAQDWMSKILGYRNWHELAQCVSSDAIEIPDIKSWADREAVRKIALLRDVFAGLVGEQVDEYDVARLFRYINPLDPHARLKRLGKLAAGKPGYKGLEYDLFEQEGEVAGIGGGACYDVQGATKHLHVYLGIPAGRTEDGFLGALAAQLRRQKLPYPGYAKNLMSTLKGHREFGFTHLSNEPYDEDSPDVDADAPSNVFLADQSRWYRFFVMDGTVPIGAVSLEISVALTSDSDTGLVTVSVDEGWAPSSPKGIFEALVYSLVDAVCEPLRRLMWFRIQNPTMDVEVSFESESESQLAWSLVAGLRQVVPRALSGGRDDDVPGFTFRHSICP